jgi:acetyl-CoA carboxylase biotin carboxyl carrier protein
MDLKALKALIRLVKDSDLEELELEEEGRRVRIRRLAVGPVLSAAARSPVSPPASTVAPKSRSEAAAEEAAGFAPIEAPMVGTFYRAPAPDAPPYVQEGDLVQKGTVLCIIEAMKLMNEIESEVKGRIAKVLVENGQAVEFGQPLFLVEPI